MKEILYQSLIPNWFVHKLSYACELQDAVYLMLNVEKEVFDNVFSDFRACDNQDQAILLCCALGYEDDDWFNEISNELYDIKRKADELLEVFSNHLAYGNLEFVESRPRYAWYKIQLAMLGDFVLSLGLEIPVEFPRTLNTNEQVAFQSDLVEPPPPRPGNKDSQIGWVEWYVQKEGHLLEDVLPYGFKAQLKMEISKYGISDSVVDKLWRHMGLSGYQSKSKKSQ